MVSCEEITKEHAVIRGLAVDEIVIVTYIKE